VVWLDDTPTEKYITATKDGLADQDLVRILSGRGPVVIVDSMWQARYSALMAEPRLPTDGTLPTDPTRKARDALRLAGEPVVVEGYFTPDERRLAASLAADDHRLADALADTRFGVTQALSGAPALIRRYHDAESSIPYAYAVMTAAIDACRLGHNGPFGEDFLQAAALGYLSSQHRAAIVDSHLGSGSWWFSEAMTYATDTDANPGHVAPLIPALITSEHVDTKGYSVADYLLQYCLRERRHVQAPTTTWEALLTFIGIPVDLASRLFENGRIDELRQRADAGDDRARELLANWLFHEDRITELRHRADTGDNIARRLLAGWLSERDRVDEAIVVIRPLADAGDDAARSMLARWLHDEDRVDEAIVVIRPLADAGDEAARLLAGWLSERDRVDEAIVVIRPLADAGDDAARRLLARCLLLDGRINELRQRADAGDGYARSRLARWLLEQDRSD